MDKLSQWKTRKRELKYTNQDIAYLAGLPLRTVEQIMCGKVKTPRLDTVMAIDKALGLENENSPTQTELSEGEKYLLELFNRIPADKQEIVLQMIRAALEHL